MAAERDLLLPDLHVDTGQDPRVVSWFNIEISVCVKILILPENSVYPRLYFVLNNMRKLPSLFWVQTTHYLM